MHTVFDINTDEGNIHLDKVGEFKLTLVINEKPFDINGYPKNMIDASRSAIERKREYYLIPFTLSTHRGQISHHPDWDIFIFSLDGHEAFLEGDELKLMTTCIQDHLCV